MGLILDYMGSTFDGKVKVYDSQKRFIDESELDTFGEFDDHKWVEQPKDKSQIFAEDKPGKQPQIEIKHKDIDLRKNKSRFKFFLDGTRHVYKVGDIAIDGVVYPLAVGQIIVGYCGRDGRNIKIGRFERRLILAVPVQWDMNNQGINFFRRQCYEINARLRDTVLYSKFGIQLDSVIPYGKNEQVQHEMGRNKYLRLATTCIQNEMLDQERLLVQKLVMEGTVSNNDAMLIKDGSIEYKKDFTNRPEAALADAKFNLNFRDVVGVSKGFDPELLNKREPRIGTMIAELKPRHRTRAYRYIHEGKSYCVWYLRLRDTINRSNNYADIIKIEMYMPDDKVMPTTLINVLSAHLINEAYPVCYGKDSRWANHLYPVHVTELFCKSMFIDEKLIIRII
ncbi:hypothetical protein [Duncaniella muris]|uniref:hypothetical protein n=1 Tax=Duncaniella muris TaxID=2094150 RepID=UPI001C3DD2E9|nr:hypothetical protein [Duncaniella muris]